MKRSKPLGLWSATALVTGNMIGSGVFLLPSSLAGFGGISLVGWLWSATGAMMLALVFAGLARQVAGSGGPYVYTRAAFGDLPGFLVAWGYWVSMLAGNAAIATALVGYLSAFVPALDTHPHLATGTALLVIWVVVAINVRGVRAAGRFQVITTVLKLLPLVALGLLAPFVIDTAQFEPWNRSGQSDLSAITATAALTLWAFVGMESANIPASEVERPETTVPRAAVIGTLLAAVVYIPSTVSVMGIVSPGDLAHASAPFADAARTVWGDWAYFAVAGGAAISCLGALNGWTLCVGQIPLAAAQDRLFPRSFSRVTRFGTPAVGIVVSSVLVSALVLMNYSAGLVDQFTFVALLATVSALLPYLLCALARITLAWRERQSQPIGPFGFAVAGLATAFSAWAIAGTGATTVMWAAVLLVAGLPVFWWLRRREGPADVTHV